MAALGALTSGAQQALRTGGRFPLLPEDYARALDELEALTDGTTPTAADAGAPQPSGPGTPAPSGPAASASSAPVVVPSATAPATTPATTPGTTPAAARPAAAPAASSGPLTVIAAVAGAVLLVLLVGRLVRRRRTPVMSARQVVGLLDAGRLLSQARDDAEVASVATCELARLLRVGGAVLVAWGGDAGPAVLSDPAGVLAAGAAASDGVLGRVATTGQGAVQTLDEDPALGSRAVVAVPVLVGGAVRAVLAAVRPAAQPFGVEDLRVAAELAPLVASALQGAATLADVRAQAGRDALTGLPNRRSLDADLHAEVGRQEGRTTAVAMVDVDHFKAFNDREGHAGGDLALRAVATVLADCVREQDSAYRYGGEEFCLLLRQITRAEAVAVLETVLAAVRAVDVPGAARQPAGYLSVSAGVALVGGEEPAEAVRRADEALYEAKREGRDRFAVADDLPRPVPPAQRRPVEQGQDAAASPSL